MSSSNTFTRDLTQTSLNDAYKYHSFSNYINNMKLPTYSAICIFCSAKETTLLMDDGSFRKCKICNRQFKATILRNS